MMEGTAWFCPRSQPWHLARCLALRRRLNRYMRECTVCQDRFGSSSSEALAQGNLPRKPPCSICFPSTPLPVPRAVTSCPSAFAVDLEGPCNHSKCVPSACSVQRAGCSREVTGPASEVPWSLCRMVLGKGQRLRSQVLPLPLNPRALHFLCPHSGQPVG